MYDQNEPKFEFTHKRFVWKPITKINQNTFNVFEYKICGWTDWIASPLCIPFMNLVQINLP